MSESENNYIECRSYTHARRHPFVIGTIGGWHLPSPLTPTQLLVLLVSFGIMFWTMQLLTFLGALRFVLLLLVPGFLTWSIRHMRMEGSAPIRMLMGYATYRFHPRDGTIHGRSNRDKTKQVMKKDPIYMLNFPEEWEKQAQMAEAIAYFNDQRMAS
jgi:hypothetical protein